MTSAVLRGHIYFRVQREESWAIQDYTTYARRQKLCWLVISRREHRGWIQGMTYSARYLEGLRASCMEGKQSLVRCEYKKSHQGFPPNRYNVNARLVSLYSSLTTVSWCRKEIS